MQERYRVYINNCHLPFILRLSSLVPLIIMILNNLIKLCAAVVLLAKAPGIVSGADELETR